jgi:hypothetical protein
MQVKPRQLKLAKNDGRSRPIKKTTSVVINMDGKRERIIGYIVSGLFYDIIFGKKWTKNDVIYMVKRRIIRFGNKKNGRIIREKGWINRRAPAKVKKKLAFYLNATKILGSTFAEEIRRSKRQRQKNQEPARFFAISIEDINKALKNNHR